MSKVVVIGIVSAGGVGAVGIGGYALFGNGFGLGGGSDAPATPGVDKNQTPKTISQPTAKPKISQDLVISEGGTTNYEGKLEKFDELKEAVKDWKCFTTAFGADVSFESNTASSSIDWATVDFGSPITPSNDNDDKKYTSCARVQARKITFSADGSNKYEGVFSWSWAFKGTQKGLAFFGVAKTNETNKNLDVEGVVYVLDKNTSGGDSEIWKVAHKQESGKKTLTSGEAWNKLPAPSNYLSGNFDDKSEWQWLNSGHLNNIANGNETEGKRESVAYILRWSYDAHNTSTHVYGWCKDLNWWEHLFDNTSSTTLKNKLTNWKGGW